MEPITVRVKEYSAFRVGDKTGEIINGYCTLKKSTFESLEKFVLENNKDGEDGALEIMSLSARRGIGKIITVKNHVGIISMKDGTMIEILPKIYSDKKGSEKNTRKLLIDMLKTLQNPPHKNLQTTNVDISKMNILEVFIRMFVDEVFRLVQQGLKSNYESLEDNLPCFKGKIQFSKHIRHNFAHKERVYVGYDEFTSNRPENKLLKSTLAYLYSHTRSARTKKDIKNLLNIFADIDLSVNYDADFAKIVSDRNTKEYTTAINWARVFLKGKSFTSFSGSTVSLALLFPMEKLFESYIAALLQKELPTGYSMSTQDARYHLFDEPKRFSLRPDIVIENRKGNVFIMDTKWKLLNDNLKDNYGISQADMYQMYVYNKKCKVNNQEVKSVTLIYPKPEKDIEEITFKDNSGVIVFIKFVDMLEIKKSIDSIKEMISMLAEK